MPYGLEKLSQEPSSLTERIWGSVRLVDGQVSERVPIPLSPEYETQLTV